MVEDYDPFPKNEASYLYRLSFDSSDAPSYALALSVAITDYVWTLTVPCIDFKEH